MRFSPAILFSLIATLFFSGCSSPTTPRTTTIEAVPAPYRGWAGALRLQNEHVEAIVVPEIGRVMSFRFRDGDNVFWEDATLAGRRGDPSGKEWVNFGGDKTWPAPEAEWKTFTRHATWMPPAGFDGLAATARIEGDAIVLTSAVDPAYGIRAVRRIALQPREPVMTIATTFERVSGAPAKIGVWVITQFKEPVAAFVPVPERSQFPGGHFAFRDTPWPQLTPTGNLIKVTRDPRANHKLGADADRMLWVGEQAMCLVSTPRTAAAEYPDRGASVEIYTNSDPKAYVELETLGPLALLKPGDTLTQTNTYTLLRRAAGANADAEARRILLRR